MSLDDALARLVAAVRGGSTLLVALDFDGVLAPLVDQPSAARATPAGAAALARLTTLDRVHLALVSGRGLADLTTVADPPPGTTLVGGHGAEVGDGTLLDPDQAATLTALADGLRAATAGTTARIEVKPASVAMHTRGSDPAEAARLATAALELAATAGVTPMQGHDVVELPVLTVTKGDALRRLRAETGADLVLFAGDDVTDENAFAVLEPGDLGVKVGPGPTLADHRVADPAAIADLLHRLADQIAAD